MTATAAQSRIKAPPLSLCGAASIILKDIETCLAFGLTAVIAAIIILAAIASITGSAQIDANAVQCAADALERAHRHCPIPFETIAA